MGLEFHHVGCLVEDISAALKSYAGTSLGENASAAVAVSAQKVRVCFLPLANGTYLEFVEPAPENTSLIRMLRKGISYYHVGYQCANIDAEVQQLVTAGAHELTRFASEAFAGRTCVFLITAQQQMIELIQSA